eukprot:2781225-Amphidinium_carterae.1
MEAPKLPSTKAVGKRTGTARKAGKVRVSEQCCTSQRDVTCDVPDDVPETALHLSHESMMLTTMGPTLYTNDR